jgi:PAS domain S-box-containing protein
MLRILLIDDNPGDRLLAVRALKQEFADLQVQEVIQAKDLEQGLEDGQFDLVITDYQLRWSDGLAVLRTIKLRYPDCPVIMFTNSGTQEIAVEAMKAGLDDYVIKSSNRYKRLPIAVGRALEQAEAQRKAATLEVRFQSLLNQLNVGIYRMTSDGILLEGNPAFLRLLGLASLTDIPANLRIESYFQPADYAELLDQLQQGTNLYNRDIQLRRADGTWRWVRVSKTATIINGTTIIDGLMEDINDRKQAEQEREQLLRREQQVREAAEAANRIKDEFLAILSHELRSPLNPILGWTKLLRSRDVDEPTMAHALEVIERNTRLQAQLIEDLLDVSRILRGKLSLAVSSVDLAMVITAALETVHLAADAKSIQIQTQLEPIAEPVAGDAGRLQQIVWNLLSNAVKFTPEGGRIEVHLKQVDSHAQIQVKDTGKGIHPAFLPHVFDYFRQADSTTTREFGGLGLGLAIVHHLVELHGGTVWADSPGEGHGATFTVRLPLFRRKGEDEKGQKGNSHPHISSPPHPLTGLRILVVDDDPDTRDFLTFVMEQHGATVTAAASVQAALTCLEQVQPDLLLSDIGMPEADGYTLIQQVKVWAANQGKTIPAIALTAYASQADQQRAIAAGFQRHLTKPIEPERLVREILQLMAKLR